MYRKYFKRLLDILISFVALILLCPFLLIIIIILFFANNGSGVFFFQRRPGKDALVFKVIKFKTMIDLKDNDGHLMPDYLRITRIGKIVRLTSIDEIPQLINVLNGRMSLIGPRPLLFEYLPLYNEKQARRHEVKPGMTGWAQVNGRNAITWEQKFEYDVWYVDHLSFGLDIKILFSTVKRVFYRNGINAAKDVTMEPFKGVKK